ncbi:MAG: chemotaxis protein MotA [Myxococcota bacterium]|jgi:chemotaxis protein MotA
MDTGTVIGFVTAFGLIVASMVLGGSVGAFIDVPSLLIVLGGTTGVLLINYPMEMVKSAGGVAKNAFFAQVTPPKEIIERIVNYAAQSRRDGVLALEGALETEPDEFLKKGLQLVVDGQDVEAIEAILDTEISNVKKRHEVGAEFWTGAATFAPAMGLIGTLIGLVQMLGSMEDPSSIGPAMAVALLTTFYGALFANAVFTPIAGKLGCRSSDEVMIKDLSLQGILQIAGGANPRIVETQLHAYLAPKLRQTQFD